MPEPIIIKIVSYLALEDIAKLSQVNNQFREVCRILFTYLNISFSFHHYKIFFKLCRSDRVWILLYQKYYTRDITKELYSLAQKKGWRNIFFTNKIKLQVRKIIK